MPSRANAISLTPEEGGSIPEHLWRKVEETEDFIRWEARVTLPNGMKGTVLRTEQKGVDELLAMNEELRKVNSERRYTAGMGSDKGGNMPMVHTAQIPLNIYFRDIAPRIAAGDHGYAKWWRQQPENAPFLVRDAKGMRK